MAACQLLSVPRTSFFSVPKLANVRLTIEEDDEISISLRVPMSNVKIIKCPITNVAFVGEMMPTVSHKSADFSKVYIKEIDDLRKKLSQKSLKKTKNSKRKTI